eukprot:GDKI01039059.1.p1 GENE.GDKI01039059.1~~GDKI01039059.1.p1  ORF type:complete len:388 (-),score=69.72 GDKI01039059.1:225-1388(-)
MVWNMPDVLETTSHFSSIGSFVLALGAAATAPAFGVVPRAGPLRAVVLGLSSFVRRPAMKFSDRQDLRDILSSTLKNLPRNEYVVVVGPKGVGKSTLVDTVLRGQFGVTSVVVLPATPAAVILNNTYQALARVQNLWLGSAENSAIRVVRWYRFWFLRGRPTVVLRVRERDVGEAPAGVASAVRTLADQGIRVIVDSFNSLTETTVTTTREVVVPVEPMSAACLEKVEEFKKLVVAMQQERVFDLAFAVLGGMPNSWQRLVRTWESHGCKNTQSITEEACSDALMDANRVVVDATRANPRLKELYTMFRSQEFVPYGAPNELGIPLQENQRDKVLRPTKMGQGAGKELVLVPASPAVRLVLRHSTHSRPPSLKTVLSELKHTGTHTP